MIITSIHTGRALDGGRKAQIFVDPDVQAGMLAPLRDYLISKGLTATPGYEDGHLLRIRGLKDDAQLENLLNDFETHAFKPFKAADKLRDPAKPFLPLDRERDERAPFNFKRYIGKYSTALVGVTSLVSGMAFLTKDLLHQRSVPPQSVERTKNTINAVAAGAFVAASTMLTFFGFAAARKPSVTELIDSLEPRIKRGLDSNDLRDTRSAWQRNYDYARNNPWQIATLVNAFGTTVKTTGHSIPTLQTSRNPITMKQRTAFERDKLELASSVTAFTSLGFLATAATQNPPTLLGIPSFEESRFASDPFKQHSHPFSPMDPANDRGAKGHLNMKIAGFLGMASNAGFGAKGVLDVIAGYRAQDELGRRAFKSWPLLLVLPFNLAADYLTTISKPRFVYSLDDLATESAAYIARKLEANRDGDAAMHQVFVLSELLAQHPRMTRTSHQLREAIAGRLRLDYGYEFPSGGEGLKEYQHLWEVSPFTKKEAPETVEKTEQTTAPEHSGFIQKLQAERQAIDDPLPPFARGS